MALKIAPDLDTAQIAAIADALRRHRIDGVIATNTTLSRAGVEGMPNADEAGGLSGAPVFPQVHRRPQALSGPILRGEVPIIGVGGIMSGADAGEGSRRRAWSSSTAASSTADRSWWAGGGNFGPGHGKGRQSPIPQSWRGCPGAGKPG